MQHYVLPQQSDDIRCLRLCGNEPSKCSHRRALNSASTYESTHNDECNQRCNSDIPKQRVAAARKKHRCAANGVLSLAAMPLSDKVLAPLPREFYEDLVLQYLQLSVHQRKLSKDKLFRMLPFEAQQIVAHRLSRSVDDVLALLDDEQRVHVQKSFSAACEIVRDSAADDAVAKFVRDSARLVCCGRMVDTSAQDSTAAIRCPAVDIDSVLVVEAQSTQCDKCEQLSVAVPRNGGNNSVPIGAFRLVQASRALKADPKVRFKRPRNYIKFDRPSRAELDSTIEYDLDSDDERWLIDTQLKLRKPIEIDVDSFEAMIDTLEKASFRKLAEAFLIKPNGTLLDGRDVSTAGPQISLASTREDASATTNVRRSYTTEKATDVEDTSSDGLAKLREATAEINQRNGLSEVRLETKARKEGTNDTKPRKRQKQSDCSRAANCSGRTEQGSSHMDDTNGHQAECAEAISCIDDLKDHLFLKFTGKLGKLGSYISARAKSVDNKTIKVRIGLLSRWLIHKCSELRTFD